MSLTWDTIAWEKAISEFNAGQYFECHETLELWWLQADEPLKTFLQGIIQIAAGLIKARDGNTKGCKQLLERGLQKILAAEKGELLTSSCIERNKLDLFQDKIRSIQERIGLIPTEEIIISFPKIDF